jgi:hypothetical protein
MRIQDQSFPRSCKGIIALRPVARTGSQGIRRSHALSGLYLHALALAGNIRNVERLLVLVDMQVVPLPRQVRKTDAPDVVQHGQAVVEPPQFLDEREPRTVRALGLA